jgi:hypothetical protein
MSGKETNVKKTEAEIAAEQQQMEQALEAGYAGVRGTQPPAPIEKATTTKDDSAGNDDQGSESGQDSDKTPQPKADKETGADHAGDEGGKGSEDNGGAGSETATDDDDSKPVTLTAGELKGINKSLERLKELETTISQIGELKNLSDDRDQKIHGKIGDLTRRLTELTQPGAGGGKRKITKDMLKRLSQEYGQLAESLAEDLSEILETPASSSIDKESLMKDVDTRLDTRTQEALSSVGEMVSEGILNFISPGWKSKLESKEYGEYLDSLPSGERKKIEDSGEPAFVAESIKNFEAWDTTRKQAKTDKDKADKTKARNLDKAAAQPKGVSRATAPAGGNKDDELEASMNEGYKKVSGRK